MRIVRLEQNSEVWFEFRRGRIGGSKSKGIKPTSKGKYKGRIDGTAGFWKLVAERVAIAKDGENEFDRGHRLEPVAMQMTNDKFELNLAWKTDKQKDLPGIWVSDDSEDMYISPDAAENSDAPTYAAESKAFDTDKHLWVMYEDMAAKKLEGYNPIDSLPVDNQDQAVDYFVINKGMETLYWTLINDKVAFDHLIHYTIVIKREHVQDRVEKLEATQKLVLAELSKVVKEITTESLITETVKR